MKYIQSLEKNKDCEKVVIKLLMGEGHSFVIWETSKQELQAGSSLPEQPNTELHNSFDAKCPHFLRDLFSLSGWFARSKQQQCGYNMDQLHTCEQQHIRKDDHLLCEGRVTWKG